MSGGLALLRAFCQWKIEHQVSTFISFVSCNHARWARGHAPQIYSICWHFVRWQQCPEPNTAARFKSKYLPPNNLLGEDFTIPCNHLHTVSLHLSRAQPYSCVSNLSHSTVLLDVYIPLTKSSQQRKTARHCRAVFSFLYCVAKNIILFLWYWQKPRVDAYVFARFKENCEVIGPTYAQFPKF